MSGYQQLGGGGGGSSSSSSGSRSGSSGGVASSPAGFHQDFVSLAVAENQTQRVNKYDTALPIRVDIEAAAAYALGCISGIMLLILETKNDYVRFHAWQSTIVFAFMLVMHFFWMFISTVISWMLFVCDVALIGWLSYRAYVNGDSLERYELPYVGAISSRYVDTE
ncbi:hypothetical protein SeLEV6574_g02645 [Synchytrium endobioticum]|uniref:Uncharacterized protein n=1 Tax=Synchytrium endobioticum TaxID=286115 RepID=A0A507D868_9FUNG|nr:hypothetical protein SeLEV6574_g02645 [Synchytrium endobioticum]